MNLKEFGRERRIRLGKESLRATDLDLPLRAELFSIAATNWNELFNPEVLRLLFRDPYGNKEEIKDVRRAGLMLRAAHKLFTAAPIPEPIDDIVKAIGVHNDWMNIRNEPHYQPVLEAIATFTHAESEPTFVDDQEYRQRVNHTAREITSVASSEVVDPETFHEMRRNLKHFLGMYRMLELLHGDVPHPMHARLDDLNTLLGKRRDETLRIVFGKVRADVPHMLIDRALRREVLRIVSKVARK